MQIKVMIKYTEVSIWKGMACMALLICSIAALCFSLGVSPKEFEIWGTVPSVLFGVFMGKYVGIK